VEEALQTIESDRFLKKSPTSYSYCQPYDSLSYVLDPLLVVSRRYPSSMSYGAVRGACVKSLSCEFCPGKEGPVVFGVSQEEPTNTEWAISYMFKLPDSSARGLQRWYSLLYMSSDYTRLILTMKHIISCFRHMVSDLQRKAGQVFSRETESDANATYFAPVRTYGMFRREISPASVRSITDIVQDGNLFEKLHKIFCRIMQSVETYFEQDKPYTSLLMNEKSLNESTYIDLCSTSNENDSNSVLCSLGTMLKEFGLEFINDTIYNVIIGNQIIVRSNQQSILRSIFATLKSLLPEECCNIIEQSPSYRETWECNFLGLAIPEEIPVHIKEQPIYMLIDIVGVSSSLNLSANFSSSALPASLSNSTNSTATYGEPPISLKMRYKTSSKWQKTSLGTEIRQIVQSHYTRIFERARLESLKEEWIHKTRMFYALSLQLESPQDPRLKLFEKNMNLISNDFRVLKFWSGTLRKQYFNQLWNLHLSTSRS